ncbi:hypothetical protein DFH08DRAFT_459318 [Mycena albidolilacea]|uniref:F-box domain-containing protein n=1 Tax=Mycena albidolilacea TaxID=1033008 RepID=A0AAD7AE08_9AGAR|nr:hypothetical protein DFH08DRAFT_459318 [Mycena albidolilacea]
MFPALAAERELDRARLADLERSISELESEKKLVLDRLDSYKYPVLTLPNEITTEIFIHFLPTYPSCPLLTGLGTPTALTQICHQWREIALATPALWRAISFSEPYPSYSFEPHKRLCNIRLSRSRSYPLSLELDEDYIDRKHTTELLSTLAVHRARWEHLDFHLSLSRLGAIAGPLPLLRSLDLSVDDPEDGDDDTGEISFLDAPLLRTVVLNDIAAKNITLPWAQLTSLTLHALYPRECAPILQLSYNLVHCELNLAGGDDGAEDFPNIYLSSLQSFTLTGDPTTGYLETFIVPALRSLEISEPYIDPDCIDILASFLAKSRCKLQELRVTDRASVAEESYREAFPLVKVSFDEND